MDPLIGMIVMFGGTYAPRGWAFCDGSLLSVAENTALFSILGTIYGGDGRTTFGLPDLLGRGAMHAGVGSGPGLSPRRLGDKGGSEITVMNETQLPSHSHATTISLDASSEDAVSNTPDNTKVLGNTSENIFSELSASDTAGAIANTTFDSTGGGVAFNNMQPFLAVNFIIALQGVYPSRS